MNIPYICTTKFVIMKNRLAIDTPKKIRLIHGYDTEATLVANKGDYAGRRYGLFGKKEYHEHDVWDFHEPLEHEIVIDNDPEYTRVGDKLLVRPRVRIIYGYNWHDEKFFNTEEEAEKCYLDLVSKFRLTEVDF